MVPAGGVIDGRLRPVPALVALAGGAALVAVLALA
jgi:hypothetical protein